MLVNKQIVIGFIMVSLAFGVVFVGNAQAWDEEGGLEEGENYEIVWNDEYHVFEHKYPESPSLYVRTASGIKKVWFTLKSYFYDLVNIDIDYTVVKEEWNGTCYEETDRAMFSTGLTHNPNQTETLVSSFDPVEEYFKNNESRVIDWDGDDTEHPDVLNITVDIDGDGDSLDNSNSGYVTITDEDVEEIYDDAHGGVDYGFALDGRGSDGGSGSIYEGIDLYGGAGEESGIGAGFGWIFFGLIPIIFMFAVFKFCRRVLWG